MAAQSSGVQTLIPFRIIKKANHEVPVEHVGLVSFLSYAWLDGLMWKAFRHGVEEENIWTCPHVDSSAHNEEILNAMWEEELRTKKKDASLFRVCMKFLRKRHLVAALLMIFAFAVIIFGQAYVYMSLLIYLSLPGMSLGAGIGYVFGLFAAQLVYTILFMAVFTVTHIAGFRLRTGLLSLVYQKLLRLASMGDKTSGQIVNIFANDSTRIFDGASFTPMLLAPPFLTLGATAYAIYLLGAWALIGFVILLLLFPLQMCIGKTIMHFRAAAITVTDQRVKMMNETLSSAKFVKMYTWEEPLSKLIANTRDKEKGYLEKANISTSIAMLSSAMVVAIATMCTIIVYSLLGNDLTFVQVFTYLILYSSITAQLDLATMSLKYVSEFKVATDRIQTILLLDECNPKLAVLNPSMPVDGAAVIHAVELNNCTLVWPTIQAVEDENEKEDKPDKPAEKLKAEDRFKELETAKLISGGDSSVRGDGGGRGCEVRADATYTIPEHKACKNCWHSKATSKELFEMDKLTEEEKQSTVALKGLDLKIQKNDVVGIVGTVGSGKTALVNAILGQLTITEGEIIVNGKLAYVPQQPWIFNATVRENIIFNSAFDSKKYQEVLNSCCLKHDLDLLPAGDLTEIGERGVNLSGGQRHRVSIARAAYSERDIVLLDDPFSSLDPDVADDIYANVIQGSLMGRTILLVTNQTKYLPECDYIVQMRDGAVVEQGTHQELMDLDGQYAALIDTYMNVPPVPYGRQFSQASTVGVQSSEDEFNVQSVPTSPLGNGSTENQQNDVFKFNVSGKQILSKEEKEVGSVSMETYAKYISAAGGATVVVVGVLVALLAEGSRAFSLWWLGTWLADGSGNTTVIEGNITVISKSISDNPNLRFYNLIYGLSLIVIIITFALRSVVLVKIMMKASSTLHNLLFTSVVHSPMSFFDTTPHGRIINRFSKDQDELDSGLPPMIDSTIKNIISVVLYLILIGAVIHWFLIAVPFMLLIFVFVYTIFRVGARETKRLQNISMSPLLSHVAGTIHGLACLRAFDKEKSFLTKFRGYLDNTTATLMIYTFAMRWVNIRLTLITATIVCITALMLVLLKNTVQPEFAGVALIYAVQLTGLLQFLVRSAVESEARFTSGERIINYIENLEQEQMTNPRLATPNDWPNQGAVEFSNYDMRYRDGLPLVLRGITCNIKAHENIGIVGRTGAGKSSLTTALFRLVEAADGCIKIDNIDISEVGLKELRSNISIIPQEPVLFSGTIRRNLDPFGRHIDHELWRALDKCHMKNVVSKLEGELEAVVIENGANFSVGERQLLCLGRVLLRRTRILILDEATASVDNDTAEQIQKCLHEAFEDCTILVIAHRLETVMQCHKVMVIEDGQLVEFDEPKKLLAKKKSRFHQLMASPGSNALPESPDPLDTTAWV